MGAERAINLVLGAVLIVALTVIGCASIRIWQLDQQLTEANNTITKHAQNVAVLGTAVSIQNEEVADLAEESKRAIEKSTQALAGAKPVIEEQERRILGIRSAPDSNDPEVIRQKMLKDAMQ